MVRWSTWLDTQCYEQNEAREVNNKNQIINSIDVLTDYACTVFIYLLLGKLGSSTEHQEEKMVDIKLWWFVVNEWPCYH